MSGSVSAAPGKTPRVAGNTCTGLIKLIAVFFMLIDHSAILFFKNASFYIELRLLGRIALPLFAWGCVLGCEYTRNIWLYALRVLAAGFAIQWLYMPVMNHDWTYLNIFFTLSVGILAVALLRELPPWLGIPLCAAAVALPCLVQLLTGAGMDYSWKGVLLILILYLCRKDAAALAAAFFAFCLFWGGGTSAVRSFFGIPFSWPAAFNPLLEPMTRLQFFGILALPVILVRPRFDFRVPLWVSYAIYPAHLLLLAAIRCFT